MSIIKELGTRSWPLLLILTLLAIVIYFNVPSALDYTFLQTHHQTLKTWAAQHNYAVVVIFMLIYIGIVAISIPGATILTLAAGMLFGLVKGTLLVIFSATFGATLLYLCVTFSITFWLTKINARTLAKMRYRFNENAFHYLLVLRLIPILPFWLVNIVPALLNVPLKTFIVATFFGIIPGSLVYVSLGNSLNVLFASHQAPDLKIIFSFPIFLPLMGLAAMSLFPVFYRSWTTKSKRHAANHDTFDDENG